jgi:hypothetical protein
MLILLIILPPIIYSLIGALVIYLFFWLVGIGLFGQSILKSVTSFVDMSGVTFIIMIIVGIYAFLSSLVSWIILIPSRGQLDFKAKINKVLLISLLIIPIIMIVAPALFYYVLSKV